MTIASPPPAGSNGHTAGPSRAQRGARRSAFRDLVRSAGDYRSLRTSKYGMGPLVLLVLIELGQQFDNSVYGTLQVEIRRGLGVSVAAVQTVASIATIMATMAAPLIGYLADRVRRTVLVAAGTFVTAVITTFTGLAGSVPILALIRGLDTVGESAGAAPLRSLLADYYGVDDRGKAFAFHEMAGKLGGILAPVLVGAIGVRYGWRYPFFVVGPFVAVLALGVSFKLRDPVRGYWERKRLGATDEIAEDEEPPMSFAEAFRTIMATRVLRRILLAYAVYLVGFLWYSSLYQFFLAEKFGLNALERALITVPGLVLAFGGVFLGGGLADRLIRRRPSRLLLVAGGVLLAGAGSVLVVAAVPVLWVLVTFSAITALIGALTGPATATVMSLATPPRVRGQAFGVFAIAVLPAQLLTPVSGLLSSSFGLQGGLLCALPVIVVGALLFMSAASYFESDMRAAISASMASEEYRRAKAEQRIKLLVCRGVDVHYGNVQVLFDVDFEAHEGEIIALLGTNGAGKSTLLRAISGTQEASNGAVVFDGRNITHVPPYEIARLGVVHMPGGRGVFPGLSVRENLDLALWSVPATERPARLEEVFGFFPILRASLDKPAGVLSGGEQQMVALGQAFLARPRLLMIDELSLGLAPAVVQQLLEIIRAMHGAGTTIILVEQSVNVALTVAQRAVFMEKGSVRFEGATRDLLARPDIMRAVYVKGSSALAGASTVTRRSRGPQEPGRPILEASGLTKRYGGVTAVDDVSLTLHDGDAVGLIGPNGAGKTTVFDLLSGYQPLDAGTVILDGVDITGDSPDARARRQLLRRFQDARLFPSLTVFEAITLALERKLEVRNTFITALQLPAVRRGERRVQAQAIRLIEMLELEALRDKFVAELSTGLRRIVDLACVVAAEPRVLLLDEPSSGIAQAEAENLGPLLRRVRYETGCSLLVIEHDMALITSITDELVAMVQGRVVTRGAAADVLRDPTVIEAYLGSSEVALQRQGALPTP